MRRNDRNDSSVFSPLVSRGDRCRRRRFINDLAASTISLCDSLLIFHFFFFFLPIIRRRCPTSRRRGGVGAADPLVVSPVRVYWWPMLGDAARWRRRREEGEEVHAHCWRRESAGADRTAPAGREFSSQFLCTTVALPPSLSSLSFSRSFSFPFLSRTFSVSRLLSADPTHSPLFIRLSFVVLYSPPTSGSGTHACIDVCICVEWPAGEEGWGGGNGRQESRVYGTLADHRGSLSPGVSRGGPFTGVDLREIRPPEFLLLLSVPSLAPDPPPLLSPSYRLSLSSRVAVPSSLFPSSPPPY